MSNPFSFASGHPRELVHGLVQRIPARILRRIPARHRWALLMVLLVFSAPAGLWHGCADSSGLPPLVPALTLRGVYFASWVSLFEGFIVWTGSTMGYGQRVTRTYLGELWFLCTVLAGDNSPQSKPAPHHLTFGISVLLAASSVLWCELVTVAYEGGRKDLFTECSQVVW